MRKPKVGASQRRTRELFNVFNEPALLLKELHKPINCVAGEGSQNLEEHVSLISAIIVSAVESYSFAPRERPEHG